jgi:hypothetical protein
VAGARSQFAALLPMMERVLGPTHPELPTARDNLARWIGETGMRPGARDQYAALLPAMDRVLGAEHPQTLYVRGRLPYWTRRLTVAGTSSCWVSAIMQATVLRPNKRRPGDKWVSSSDLAPPVVMNCGPGGSIGARDGSVFGWR